MDIIGWLGCILFAICPLPQVVKTYKSRCANDLSICFLFAWLAGEVFTAAYVASLGYGQWSLLANYAANGVMCSYLVWAKCVYRLSDRGAHISD